MFSQRADAIEVRNVSTMRRFMSFISPRRNESCVYFSQDLDVEEALLLVESRRAGARPITLFHLFLRAYAIVLQERERLNRFTAGGRLWQRDGVYITFSAKQELVDGAPVVTVKRRFDTDDSLDGMVEDLLGKLSTRRRGERTVSDKEMELGLRVPAFVTRFVVRMLRWADSLGLLTRGMIDSDPLFTSMFVANLGSVGLDAAYHHLWEYGSCPLFVVIGRVETGEGGRRKVTLKYTYDERIEDGMYAAISLERVRDLMATPGALLGAGARPGPGGEARPR
jgi:hypothetical protein